MDIAFLGLVGPKPSVDRSGDGGASIRASAVARTANTVFDLNRT